MASPGASPYWFHTTNLPLKESDSINYYLPSPINQQLTEQHVSTTSKLKYTNYPSIYCESASKEGLFVDTTSINREFSELIKLNIQTNSEWNNEKKELLKLYINTYNMESNTRKIILVSNKLESLSPDTINWGSIFIFYLTYINNDWYLTIIDFTDCFLS